MATEESDYATQETEPEEDNVLAVKDDVPEQPEALESPSKIADDDRILLDTRHSYIKTTNFDQIG